MGCGKLRTRRHGAYRVAGLTSWCLLGADFRLFPYLSLFGFQHRYIHRSVPVQIAGAGCFNAQAWVKVGTARHRISKTACRALFWSDLNEECTIRNQNPRDA